MKTIVLANHKGGCAKTTTALNIAVALAAKGSRVRACATNTTGGINRMGWELRRGKRIYVRKVK